MSRFKIAVDALDNLPPEDNAPSAPSVDAGPMYRDFFDTNTQRQYVNNQLMAALGNRQFENARYRLGIRDVSIRERQFVPNDERTAMGERGNLHHPINGTWYLEDKETGEVVDQKRGVVAYAPHLTDRGTYIVNGSNYIVNHQTRLRPGVYTFRQRNGNMTTQFNIRPKTGRGFRVDMDPESGQFKLRVGQGESKLYPFLRAAGVSDEDMRKAWGDDIWKANKVEDRNFADVKKTVKRLGIDVEQLNNEELGEAAKSIINQWRVDDEVMDLTHNEFRQTLGAQDLVRVAKRMVDLNKSGEDGDDRDSLAFQEVWGPEDLFAERIDKDAGKIGRKLLWKATRTGNLQHVPSAAYRDAIYGLFNGTGNAQVLEDTNPITVADMRLKLSRMGEGGLRSTEASPREARGVQPSHMGLIDPVRTPESEKIGLDMRAAWNTFKGRDKKLYTAVVDKAGNTKVISALQMLKGAVAFPGELHSEGKFVRAMVGGKVKVIPRRRVDHWLMHGEEMFAPTTNLVPMASAVKPQRLLMGARMTTQAMPLVEREAPFVRTAVPGEDRSFDELLGEQAGARRAKGKGRVTKVTSDAVHVRYADGTEDKISMYNELPLNRMTNLSQRSLVEPGQVFDEGQVLVASNFTDDSGATAMGRNLRVGYLAHEGATFEDAVVLRKGAADMLGAEVSHKYNRESDKDTHTTNPNQFRSLFPSKYSGAQLQALDDDGVIKKGTVLHRGDPILLQVNKAKRSAVGALMRSEKQRFSDQSQEWDHDHPGQVIDVFKSKSGNVRTVIRSYLPAQEGDKLSGRFGDKGVISKIIPDDQMPADADGNPLDILVSPAGVISRTNPAQVLEAALGKIAERTGKHINMPAFRNKDMKSLAKYVQKKLDEAGLSDTEDVIDPPTGRRIKDVMVGNRYYMRLHHLAEKKLSTRDTGLYTQDDTPAKGGDEGSKRIGMAEVASLLSAGATDVIKDAKMVRGQRNDDYWRAVQMGYTPQMPTESVTSRKFLEQLKAAGVNVQERNKNRYIMPMTQAAVDDLVKGREITSPYAYNWDTMEPIPGGLFDVGKTGGANGTLWSKISLPAPVINPIMQEPVQKMLGLTEGKLRDIMAGKDTLDGMSGPKAIEVALKKLDGRMNQEINAAKVDITQGSKSGRDNAVKRLRYLTSFQKMGIKPSEVMLTSLPVLPPKFRPISQMQGTLLVSDPNYLYADTMAAGENFKDTEKLQGDTGQAYLDLYDSVKAVTGIGQPVSKSLQEKNVRGILSQAVGVGRSPKSAAFQRRVIGQSLDQVGRGVIVPDSKLDIDQIGIPEPMAWQQYRKWIVRKLVQRGMPAVQAVQSVADRTDLARKTLLDVMDERPVFINRAPTLHRHSIIGGRPVLVAGDAIRLSPPVEAGLNADHDGDAIQVHVPASNEAVDDVYNLLMPSKNLLSAGEFKIHMKPENEFVSGLYRSTLAKSNKRVRIFKSTADALAAFNRGELDLSDPIRISG